MIDTVKTKTFIDYILGNKIPKDKGFELLKNEITLTSEEKNIVFLYCYPKILGDMELTIEIQEYRKKHGCNIDDPGESLLILEASRTEQYERFIKHILHSFIEDSSKITKPDTEIHTCSLCGGALDSGPHTKGFTSTTSNLVLCENCLAQFFRVKELLDVFDPGFLDWTKKWIKN